MKLLGESHSKGYYKSVEKLTKYFSKSIYFNYEELFKEYTKNIDLINSTQSNVKIFTRFLNYLKDFNIPLEVIENHKKLLKKSKCWNNDNFVPTDSEIKNTLSKLRPDLLPYYLFFLYSGIRITEGIYLLNNLDKLKVQYKEMYCKINLEYNRHNKRSFFCYLPISIYTQISPKKTELSHIRMFIKRNKLIPIKYCRKWFFTKCIELGIPESIADFYEGRVATSVGSNHYLSRQALADQNYSKLLAVFEEFNIMLEGGENK
jgi:intergrase/recombinase